MTPFGQHGHPKAFRDVWLTTLAISSSWGVLTLSLNNSLSGTLVPSQSNEQHNLGLQGPDGKGEKFWSCLLYSIT